MFPNQRKHIKNIINIHRILRWWSSFIVEYPTVITVMILVVIATFSSEYFLTWTNIMNLLRQASVIGMLALGLHFVILLGKIDLSVGSILVLSGTVIMAAQSSYGLSIPVSVLLGLLMGCVLGIINGCIITYGRVPSLITTLGMMFSFRSIAMWYASGGAVNGTHIQYTLLAYGYTLEIPNILFPLIITAFAAHYVITRTKLGRYIIAIGSNLRAAEVSGVPISKTIIISFGISGLTAGLAAVLETSRLNSISTSNSGIAYELDVIAAIVIGGSNLRGGKGKIIGTVCGVLVLSIISNYMNLMIISPYLQGVIKGVLILLVLIYQNSQQRV
jgi:ribose transport system permease protein